MKSSALLVLLIGIVVAEKRLVEKRMSMNFPEDDNSITQDDVGKETNTFSHTETRRLRIVAINAEDLKSILSEEGPLTSFHENDTDDFLTEFKQFLIPYSLDEPEKNDVIKLTADYNNKHFGTHFEDRLRLWVSFQPRMDIRDDIDLVTATIEKVNSIYPETVSAIVLNYGLLQLDDESLLLVNHEIKICSRRVENLPNERVKFALQLDIINCKSRLDFVKKVDLTYVEAILLNEPTRDLVVQNENDMLLVFMAHIGCLKYLLSASMPVVHTHMSIKISLETGSYNYNRNTSTYFDHYRGIEKLPLMFWAEVGNQNKSYGSQHTWMRGMSSKWTTWLQQHFEFSKTHVGTLMPVMEHNPKHTFENFYKIIIEVSAHTMAARENLEWIITELVSSSSLARGSLNERNRRYRENRRKHNAFQVNLLLTITNNDFKSIKKQVDAAVLIAAYVNELVPGTVRGLLFDWMPCGMSETCSGYKNVNPKVYCSIFKMNLIMGAVFNYTKLALEKVMTTTAVDFGELMDSHILRKVFKTTVGRGCDELQGRLLTDIYGLRYVLQEEDLKKYGAAKSFSMITAQLGTQTEYASYIRIFVTFYYVKIVGCHGNYSGATDLLEFILLNEMLNTWAVTSNLTIYVDAGIENLEKCQQHNNKNISPEAECQCGWWVGRNNSLSFQSFKSGDIISKKTLAKKLHESQQNLLITTTVKPTTSSINTKTLLYIFVPVSIFAALITVITIALVMRYQSKYILTKQEVANFLRGRLNSTGGYGSLSRGGESSAENAPYNSKKYELPVSSFTIDKSICVGSGEFGKVFRGSVIRCDKKKEAAVKVANTWTLARSQEGRVIVLGLLSEIKILAYLGEHDHIVSLLGAFTANMKKGEIAIFLEFCELESLQSYLRSIQLDRKHSHGNADVTGIPLKELRKQSELGIKQYLVGSNILCDELYKYGKQIACGMEFLTLKNVVHADLATRNVLLTKEKVAKISDFGLSRRMYNYTEYVKQNQAPLPWRWMAPESLRRMLFNEKSDVWAFGITLWEIFTLCDEPYPGLSWNVNFPAMLEDGLQLHEPKYNIKEIYSVMKRCWAINPNERPTFAQLHRELS